MSRDNVYVWPGSEVHGQKPPEPLKPMIMLDSQTKNSSYAPGRYGAVFNPAPERGKTWLRQDWDWWVSDAGMGAAARRLRECGVIIDFFFGDFEWEQNKIAFPYDGIDTVHSHFDMARTILKHYFPWVPVVFHGDRWQVDNVAPNNAITGRHYFHSWQERDSRPLGDFANHTTMFWNNRLASGPKRSDINTVWIEQARTWATPAGSGGIVQPIQANRETIDELMQRKQGKAVASLPNPTMLYWVTDWNHPNLAAFLSGLGA